MRWIKRLTYTLLTLYLLACTALFFIQEDLIFHPRQRSLEYDYGVGQERFVTTTDGRDSLHTLTLRPRPDNERVTLFLHGNRGDNGRAVYQARPILESGQDLVVMDYRGYGKSSGEITSEAQLLADAQRVYDELAADYGEENITLVGYSLGTGMASYLAAENDPRRLVLAAPYQSLTAMKNLWFWMTPDFLLKYDLDNEENLARTRCPVTILHGDSDRLIPYTMGERLAAVDPGRIQLKLLEGVSHRGVILSGAFARLFAKP